jgi:hypothetical protein
MTRTYPNRPANQNKAGQFCLKTSQTAHPSQLKVNRCIDGATKVSGPIPVIS